MWGTGNMHDMELSMLNKLGKGKSTSTLKSFEVEFQPFVKEINAKEEAIRECADAATMERIRSCSSPLSFFLLFSSCIPSITTEGGV